MGTEVAPQANFIGIVFFDYFIGLHVSVECSGDSNPPLEGEKP
jgi:hypothetical protein